MKTFSRNYVVWEINCQEETFCFTQSLLFFAVRKIIIALCKVCLHGEELVRQSLRGSDRSYEIRHIDVLSTNFDSFNTFAKWVATTCKILGTLGGVKIWTTSLYYFYYFLLGSVSHLFLKSWRCFQNHRPTQSFLCVFF